MTIRLGHHESGALCEMYEIGVSVPYGIECPRPMNSTERLVLDNLCRKGLAEPCKAKVEVLIAGAVIHDETIDTYRLTEAGRAEFERRHPAS